MDLTTVPGVNCALTEAKAVTAAKAKVVKRILAVEDSEIGVLK
jgi:hypothetical protein